MLLKIMEEQYHYNIFPYLLPLLFIQANHCFICTICVYKHNKKYIRNVFFSFKSHRVKYEFSMRLVGKDGALI